MINKNWILQSYISIYVYYKSNEMNMIHKLSSSTCAKLSILYIVTILVAIGFAMAVVYGSDQSAHYHSAICNIASCTITTYGCCTGKYQKTVCSTCYSVNVNYELQLSGNIYRQINVGTVSDPDYCKQQNVTCYYDDRKISESLTLYRDQPAWYTEIGIFSLGMLLVIMVLVSLITIILQIINWNRDRSAENAELSDSYIDYGTMSR